MSITIRYHDTKYFVRLHFYSLFYIFTFVLLRLAGRRLGIGRKLVAFRLWIFWYKS